MKTTIRLAANRVVFFEHDQMTGCSCLTRLRSQTQNKLTSTSSKLKHDSTRFSQKQTEKGQTLKGNRQLSQATHCQVKNTQISSVTSFKKRTSLGIRCAAMAHPNMRLRIAVSFITMFKAGPEVSFQGISDGIACHSFLVCV